MEAAWIVETSIAPQWYRKMNVAMPVHTARPTSIAPQWYRKSSSVKTSSSSCSTSIAPQWYRKYNGLALFAKFF